MLPKDTPKWIRELVVMEVIAQFMKRTYRFEGIRLVSLTKKK